MGARSGCFGFCIFGDSLFESLHMKIVLAYSGGLDTSVLLSWIGETYQAEMIAFWVHEPLAEVFSLRVMAWGFADALKGGVKGWDFRPSLGKGKLAGVPEAADFTGA